MELDLKINNLPIRLGSQTDDERLPASGFKNAGLLMRMKFKPPEGGTLIWSKNCRFTFLNNRLDVSAVLNVDKKDRDYMCGTSAFLFYAPDGLDKVICQVIGSRIQALGSVHELKGLLTELLGSPIHNKGNIAVWEDNNEQFICELNQKQTNAYFHWLRKK